MLRPSTIISSSLMILLCASACAVLRSPEPDDVPAAPAARDAETRTDESATPSLQGSTPLSESRGAGAPLSEKGEMPLHSDADATPRDGLDRRPGQLPPDAPHLSPSDAVSTGQNITEGRETPSPTPDGRRRGITLFGIKIWEPSHPTPDDHRNEGAPPDSFSTGGHPEEERGTPTPSVPASPAP